MRLTKDQRQKLEDDVYNYPTANKMGFTHTEIALFLLEKYPKVTPEDLSTKMGVVTCALINGQSIFYHTDIRLALICCIEDRNPTVFELD